MQRIAKTNKSIETILKLIALKHITDNTEQKMKFSIKVFFSKCDQIRRTLRIWSHLLEKSLMENFIFCVVQVFEIPSIDKSVSELELRFTKFSHSASRFLFLIPTVITKVPLDKDVYQ